MSYLSISTWSLHRMLGPLRWTRWNALTGTHDIAPEEQPECFTLLELPAEAAKRGYQAIEVCHFHFPATDETYLEELRQSCLEANVSLDTLLLDYGDLTSDDPVRAEADKAFMAKWIGIAASCGAKRIRIVAGEAPPQNEEAISRSAAALADLAKIAGPLGVRVISENFKPLASTAASSLKLLREAGPQVGFITDFGNYNGRDKYEQIALTVPYSSSVHVKPVYDENGIPDEQELKLCLEAVQSASYNGAYVLIYNGPGDMWEGLERVKKLVVPYVQVQS